MSISVVQGPLLTNSTSLASTISKAFTSSVAAGNLIFAVVTSAGGDATGITVSVADTLTNTYTQINQTANNGTGTTWTFFYAKNISAGANTVTATWGSTVARQQITIYEISGLSTTAPLIGSNVATGSSSSPSAGSVTSSGAGIFFAVAQTDYNYGSITAGTGWTNQSAGIAWNKNLLEMRNEASSGTFSGTATLDASHGWSAIVAGFAAAGGGGGGSAKLFRASPGGTLSGLGSSGPFFKNPL